MTLRLNNNPEYLMNTYNTIFEDNSSKIDKRFE